MAGVVVVKIKDSVAYDSSADTNDNNFRKERTFLGQTYVIARHDLKTLPQDVADLWLAADSDLEEVSRS